MKSNKSKTTINKVFCGIDFHKNTSTLCSLFEDGSEAEPLATISSSKLCAYLSNRKNYKIGIVVGITTDHRPGKDGKSVLVLQDSDSANEKSFFPVESACMILETVTLLNPNEHLYSTSKKISDVSAEGVEAAFEE